MGNSSDLNHTDLSYSSSNTVFEKDSGNKGLVFGVFLDAGCGLDCGDRKSDRRHVPKML